MKFDQLFQYVGEFGPYQQRALFVLCYGGAFAAFKAFVVLFVLDIPPHRCSLGVNDTYAIQNDDHVHLVNMSIPREMYRGQATWSSCYMYDSPYNHSADTVKCKSWVFDRSVYQSTLTEVFGIVCDNRILRSHANMASFIGQLVGTIFIGPLSDRFGRRRVCLVSSFLMVVSFASTSFVTNVYVFMVLRAVVNFSQIGSALPAFVLGMELCGPSKRVFLGMTWNASWGFGLLSLCLISYFIRHWQILHLTLSAPLIVYILWYWIVPESPRWLISKQRLSEAKVELFKMASVNKVTLPEDVVDALQVEEGKETVKLTTWFSHRSLSIITAIIFFNWFSASVVFYGLGLNVQNLTGDIYLNFAIASIVELASYAMCAALLDRVGRKALHCTCMLTCGVACIATIFPVLYGTKELDWVTVALSMVGKFGVSGGFAVISLYTAELFPTVMRNTGMSMSSFWARVGGIISPYLADIGILIGGDLRVILPLLIFGGVAVSAGLLSLLLPETLGKELPETIEDAKQLRKQ